MYLLIIYIVISSLFIVFKSTVANNLFAGIFVSGMEQSTDNPKTPEQLFEVFELWGIPYKLYNHEPIFTVEAGKHLKVNHPGAQTKNLFLRTKKKQNFLVTMMDDKSLNIKDFAKSQGLGNLSFGSDARLMEVLGVSPGSVTPFALINTRPEDITLFLDADMMEFDLLNYHPLVNNMTVGIQRHYFLEFFQNLGHIPQIVNLPKSL